MKNRKIILVGACVGTAHLQSLLKQHNEVLVLPNIDTVVPKKEPLINYTEITLTDFRKEVSERNVIPKNFYSKNKRKTK